MTMTPDRIREARLTAVAIVRETLRDNDAGVVTLIQGYEYELDDLIYPLASIAAALVVPASMASENPSSPYALLDSLTQAWVGEDGGVPGDKMRRRLREGDSDEAED